jgi:hypothetical protein
MGQETPKDDPREKTDAGSHAQTDKPWRGNPEKEQRNDGAKIDLGKHALGRPRWQSINRSAITPARAR